MKTQRHFFFIMGILSMVILCCEKETTEHFQKSDDPKFYGFINGTFTVHNNSIGYYFPDSDKVFPDLFKYQNGRGLGNGIHSFVLDYYSGLEGLVSIEKENRVEFVQPKNFISLGSLALNEPRNINNYAYSFLVSFGKRNSGGIAVVYNKEIVQTVVTDIEAGKVYIDKDWIYVFSSGRDERDSVLVRLYDREGFGVNIHRIDSIPIGNRPVDFVYQTISEDHDHAGLLILCLGKKNVPPSIAILDLITGKVRHHYHFENPDLKPENIFWVNLDFNTQILASYANNKLYKLVLADPIKATVLINKNISSLSRTEKNYIAVSRDTIQPVSNLYKIYFQSLEVFDSIPIEPKAKEIENGYNYHSYFRNY